MQYMPSAAINKASHGPVVSMTTEAKLRSHSRRKFQFHNSRELVWRQDQRNENSNHERREKSIQVFHILSDAPWYNHGVF